MKPLVVDEANANRRLDVYLRQHLPEIPLGKIMKWIRTGAVRVDGKRAKANARLAAGATVSAPFTPELPRIEVAPSPSHTTALPFSIVFEDDELLVVDKPAGIASQPGSGHIGTSLSDAAAAYLGKTNAQPGHRPGLVQRLDRDVSGLIPIGKHRLATARAQTAAREGRLVKTYVALVHGRPTNDSGTITLALSSEDAGPAAKKSKPSADGRAAVTHYRVVEILSECALLELQIETGRTHQIRAHLAAIGLPIVGDARYGTSHSAPPKARPALARPFLHATRLEYEPTGEPRRTWHSPLPAELHRLLQTLRAAK